MNATGEDEVYALKLLSHDPFLIDLSYLFFSIQPRSLLIHRVCRFYGIGSETPALGGNYEIRLSKAPGFNVTTCSDALVKAMLESREAHERAAQEDASNTGPSSTPPLAPLTSGASTPLSSGRTEGAPYGGAFLNGSGMGGGGGGGGRFGAAAATLSAGQVQGNPYPVRRIERNENVPSPAVHFT